MLARTTRLLGRIWRRRLSSRKLLTRIDAQKYVETLEELVEDRIGIDPKDLQSAPTWRKVDL